MSDKLWSVDHNKTGESWLQLYDVQFERDECWPRWEMILKWDGCCHLHEDMPEGIEGSQYWHLCGGVRSIDEMIARLQQARELAEKHFQDPFHRNEWGFDEA